LAALEEVKIKLSQFSDGHNVDPISTSLPWTIAVPGLTRQVL
jgi:hypothetical protein